MATDETKRGRFEALQKQAGSCTSCPLCETRTTLVFGSGTPDTRLMFVGEAPGKNEDLGGKPFIGAAGKFLDELLGIAGIAREDIYITNIIKCRPPKNRDPQTDEIEACRGLLREQIALIDPEVIVTLGAFATREALHTKEPISALHGRPLKMAETIIFPVFHPAAALYDPTKKDVLKADFATLGALLEQGDQGKTSGGEDPALRPEDKR